MTITTVCLVVLTIGLATCCLVCMIVQPLMQHLRKQQAGLAEREAALRDWSKCLTQLSDLLQEQRHAQTEVQKLLQREISHAIVRQASSAANHVVVVVRSALDAPATEHAAAMYTYTGLGGNTYELAFYGGRITEEREAIQLFAVQEENRKQFLMQPRVELIVSPCADEPTDHPAYSIRFLEPGHNDEDTPKPKEPVCV